MPLSGDRKLDELGSPIAAEFGYPVAAGFRLFRMSIAAVCNDGTIVPAGAVGTPSPPAAIAGLASHRQDNTGALLSLPLAIGDAAGGPGMTRCRKGTWAIPFAETPPSWANIGAAVYAVDDASVSLTQTPSGGTARLKVGVLAGIDQASLVPYTTIS